jgi:hypothetical protein
MCNTYLPFFTYNCDINVQVSGWYRLPLTNQTTNQFHERALLEKLLNILTVFYKTWLLSTALINSPPIIPTPSQSEPVHALPSHLPNINFNIIL